MAVRTDITVDWNSSPRIIEVDIASSSVFLQDLYDTLVQLEYFPSPGVDVYSEPSLFFHDQTTGKQQLPSGNLNAITLALQNARLKFADRLGPSWVTCLITGGNLLAFEEDGTPLDAIEPAAYVTVDRASASEATLLDNYGRIK